MLKCVQIQLKRKNNNENFEAMINGFIFSSDWENLRRILKELVESVVNELLQPEQNNLISQSN